MAIYYHVSYGIRHNGKFEPRIPEMRACGENTSINRICVSKSVDGCFTAIPFGGSELEHTIMDNGGYFTIITIDTDKLNIPRENIISSEELSERNLVPDSEFTGEVWITIGFEVPDEDIKLVRVYDWEVKIIDSVCVAPTSEYELTTPNTKIENVNYNDSQLSKDEILTYYAKHDSDYNYFKSLVLDRFTEDEIIDDDGENTLSIKSSEKKDVSELFILHSIALRDD